MNISFKPVKDMIVIEKAAESKGIIFPDSSKEPVSDDVFYVVAVGPGTLDDPMTVEVGDLICLVGYINTFRYKGEKVVLARAKDVVAIIKEDF
jgi:chaperonin GroES